MSPACCKVHQSAGHGNAASRSLRRRNLPDRALLTHAVYPVADGRDRPVLSPTARSAGRSAAAAGRADHERRVRPGRPHRTRPGGQHADQGIDRRRRTTNGPGPQAFPPGRGRSSRFAGRLRADRVRHVAGVARGDGRPRSRGPIPRATTARGRVLPEGAAEQLIRVRRAYPSRDPQRSLGAERTRHDVARSLDAPAGLHGQRPTRLRRSRQLPARPLPGQRHHDGHPDRRP